MGKFDTSEGGTHPPGKATMATTMAILTAGDVDSFDVTSQAPLLDTMLMAEKAHGRVTWVHITGVWAAGTYRNQSRTGTRHVVAIDLDNCDGGDIARLTVWAGTYNGNPLPAEVLA